MTTLTPTRVNRFPNPRGISTGTTSVFGARNGWTQSFATAVAGPLAAINTCVRLTCGTAGAGAGRGVDLYGNLDTAPVTTALPVVSGRYVTLSAYVRTSGAWTVQALVQFSNGTSWITNATLGKAVSIAAGTWARVSVTTLVPDGANLASFSIRIPASVTYAVGNTIDVTGFSIEDGQLGDWFDGSYSPDATLAPSWQGAANASLSVLSDLDSSVWITDGTTTVGAMEITACALERDLRRTVLDASNTAGSFINLTTESLLQGSITYLCSSFARALALDALYKGVLTLTLSTTGELTGLKHVAVGTTKFTAEKAVNGSTQWLLTVSIEEVA